MKVGVLSSYDIVCETFVNLRRFTESGGSILMTL